MALALETMLGIQPQDPEIIRREEMELERMYELSRRKMELQRMFMKRLGRTAAANRSDPEIIRREEMELERMYELSRRKMELQRMYPEIIRREEMELERMYELSRRKMELQRMFMRSLGRTAAANRSGLLWTLCAVITLGSLWRLLFGVIQLGSLWTLLFGVIQLDVADAVQRSNMYMLVVRPRWTCAVITLVYVVWKIRVRMLEAIRSDPEISIREQRAHEANRTANQIPNVVQQLERTDVDQGPFRYYKMDAIPRGICLIINNRDFQKDSVRPEAKMLQNREGTDVDGGKLKETFEKLQFIIQYRENLSDTDMVQTVNQLALSDHRGYDCFVCCILSHGTEGAIYGSNGCLVKIRDLTGPFRSQSCPTLSGKPKLFFIQACQGEEKQKENDTQMDGDTDMDVQQEGTNPQAETIPNEADFLLGYATVPGFVSYRSTSAGSLYIRKLTEILNKYAKIEDILNLLVLVNNEVCKENSTMNDGTYKQSPAPLYTLRKKLIFK